MVVALTPCGTLWALTLIINLVLNEDPAIIISSERVQRSGIKFNTGVNSLREGGLEQDANGAKVTLAACKRPEMLWSLLVARTPQAWATRSRASMDRGFVLVSACTGVGQHYAAGDIVPGVQRHRGYQQGIFVTEEMLA